MDKDLVTIGTDNSGAFLAPVLQGIQPEIGEFGRVFMAKNSAHAAFMLGAS
jgi:hypothetical protein